MVGLLAPGGWCQLGGFSKALLLREGERGGRWRDGVGCCCLWSDEESEGELVRGYCEADRRKRGSCGWVQNLLAENAQNWYIIGTCEAPGKTQFHTFSRGMYNLREDNDFQAKFAYLARKVEALELKRSGQLKSVQEIICQICETNEHPTNDCLTLHSFKEYLHEQASALNSFQRPNQNPYSQTYNLGWRDHPNFSWNSSNNNVQTLQPPF